MRGNSVSNYAPVQLGSTQPLGTVRLSYAHLWVPWNVFCVVLVFPGTLEERLFVKLKLFMWYSFALLPWVFIPFAHQTAAIIRARWADLATVEGSCKARPLPRIYVLIGSRVIFLDAYWSSSQWHRRSVLIDVCRAVCVRECLVCLLTQKVNLI